MDEVEPDRKQMRLNKPGNGEQEFLANVAGRHRKNPVRTLHRIRYSCYRKKLSMTDQSIQKISRLKLTIALESVIITDISHVENRTGQINL
jgi:hypothetical protein